MIMHEVANAVDLNHYFVLVGELQWKGTVWCLVESFCMSSLPDRK
uniref:Uncharacterized protein n=1 Tax=Anguilla anguilla TaxID=7936 RepID=A0A0E9TLW0_ANGAN